MEGTGMVQKSKNTLSPAAQRLLRALSTHGGLALDAKGQCITPRWQAPAALVEELLAQDWVQRRGQCLYITSPGERALERMAAGEQDGFAIQNRIVRKTTKRIQNKHQKVSINLAESPLAWLRRRDFISERQWCAGERLRFDYQLGLRPPRTTMVWDAPPLTRVSRGAPEMLDPTHAQLAAKRRFNDAMQAAGPGLSDVLWRVVCEGEGLETAEKSLNWPARAGKLVLILGLDRVAHYYRI